jgi:hypothetical protein
MAEEPPQAILAEAIQKRVSERGAGLALVRRKGWNPVREVERKPSFSREHVVELTWRVPDSADRTWFRGKLFTETSPRTAPAEVVSCCNPHAEVVESLRWIRELLATDRARPEEIAVAAPATEAWDEQFLRRCQLSLRAACPAGGGTRQAVFASMHAVDTDDART